jgi:hypothetical protein
MAYKEKRHILGRNVIELHMRRSSDHETLQARVAAIFRHHLLPLMEEILDRSTAGMGNLRIEKIELDLGRLSVRYLDEEFIGRVAEEFEAQLQQLLPRAQEEAMESVKTRPGSDLELLKFFFETGVLPWWADGNSGNAVEAALERVSQENPQALGQFLESLVIRQACLGRLVHSFPDHFLLRIGHRAAPEKVRAAIELLPAMRDLLQAEARRRSGEHSGLRKALWQAVLGKSNQPNSARAILRRMLKTVAWSWQMQEDTLAQICISNCPEENADLPPEAMPTIREMAHTQVDESDREDQTPMILMRAAQSLEQILKGPGMDLVRLRTIAPLLQQLYRHGSDTRTRKLLETLSRFISPFLDPENQARTSRPSDSPPRENAANTSGNPDPADLRGKLPP